MSIIKHNLEFVFFIHTKFTYTDTETDVMSNHTSPLGGGLSGRPHEARSIGEVVSPEVLTKGDL